MSKTLLSAAICFGVCISQLCVSQVARACPDSDADIRLSRLNPQVNPTFIPKGGQIPRDENAQRVLVILHGILSDGENFSDRVIAARARGGFDQVVAPSYDWQGETKQIASDLYRSLEAAYPNAKFVFDGHSKGGLVAKYIVEQVKESEGDVERLITESSPIDGALLAQITKIKPYVGNSRGFGKPTSVDAVGATLEGMGVLSPGVAELQKGSPFI